MSNSNIIRKKAVIRQHASNFKEAHKKTNEPVLKKVINSGKEHKAVVANGSKSLTKEDPINLTELMKTAVHVSKYNDLPPELHHEIALCCESDKDLAAWGSLDRDSFNAVYGGGGIWRLRFHDKFDFSHDLFLVGTSEAYATEYKFRAENIAKNNEWKGYSEKNLTKVLVGLVRDAFRVAPGQKPSSGPVESKNMKFIHDVVRKLDILNSFRNFVPEQGRVMEGDLACNAVRLLLSPWTLDRAYKVWGYKPSRNMAFSPIGRHPLYHPRTFEINHIYLLNVCNFFAAFCSRRPDFDWALSDLYHGLDASSKPKLWNSPLEQGVKPFGKTWLGMSAQINEMDRMELWRGGELEAGAQLEFLPENDFDNYKIEMSDPNDASTPTLTAFFEDIIRTLPPMDLLRAMDLADPDTVSHLPIHGRGFDGDRMRPFELVGKTYALPEQGGIPGWQHVSFVQFYPSQGRGENFRWLTYTTLAETNRDDCELWAFEGIMIPGNKVIIGRWFQPTGPRPGVDENWGHNTDFGPCLIWCTDVSEAEARKNEQKALKLEIVHNTTTPKTRPLFPPTKKSSTENVRSPKPDDVAEDDLRIPPPTKDLTAKKAYHHLLYRREDRYEIENNISHCVNLAPENIHTQIQGLSRPKSSGIVPQEQYRRMMDVWETEVIAEKAESEEEQFARGRLERALVEKARIKAAVREVERRQKAIKGMKRSSLIRSVARRGLLS